MDTFQWLPSSLISNLEVKSVGVDSDTASTSSLSFSELVGSGTAVGGIVTAVVGGDQGDAPQLQRIVSHCDCQIYYADYGGEVDQSSNKLRPSVSQCNAHVKFAFYYRYNSIVCTWCDCCSHLFW